MIFIPHILKLVFILIFLLNASCTNTRVILEGTKKVLSKKEKNKDVNVIESITLGHYKVGNPYVIDGIQYIPKLVSNYDELGIASWYGPKFNLKKTANGEIFDQNKISAAHKTLPLPSIVKVIDIKNKKSIYLRVNDRGPFVNDRIIDFSKEAAKKFNFFEKGTTKVRVQLIDSGPHLLEKKYLNHSFLSKYAKNLEKNKLYKQNKKLSFILQIGAFKEKDNAINLLNFLKTKINDNLFLRDINNLQNKLIYKVFVGPFDKKENAKVAADKLIELGFSIIYKKE